MSEAGTRRVAVLSDYLRIAPGLADWHQLAPWAVVDFFHAPFADDDALVEALAPHEALCLMRERVALPRQLLERLPKLRFVVSAGTVNRAIDFEAARERGIRLAGTGSGDAREATAELTWALLLALSRNVVREDQAVRGGEWQTSLGGMLKGRTLGLVGLGGVGRIVARYAAVFGMNALAWSPRLTEARALEAGAVSVPLGELLARSDIVSIHLPLTEETRSLLDVAAFAAMKRGALLINTSRGPLVDEAAMLAALRDGQLGGAALDVFDREPLPGDHPLVGMPNVVLSPHVGGFTEEVYRTWYGGMVEALLAWFRDEPARPLSCG